MKAIIASKNSRLSSLARSTMPSSTLCSAEDAGSGAWPSGGCEEPSAISRAFAAPSNILAAGVARGLAAQHGIEG
jgi:hypothetical protein